jgi:Uncharacterized membrane protein (homolog of Drosophila rhomboid)
MTERKKQLAILMGIAAIIIGCHLINMVTSGALSAYFGLKPRQLSGLWGILFAPCLHGSWAHLWANLPVLLLFSALIMWDSTETFIKVSVFIIFFNGLLVWIFGRNANHIGASGWIFGLWAWLIVRSYFQHNLKNFLISALVIFLYGGIAWGLLPKTGISVEGHIAGAVCGIMAAYISAKKGTLHSKKKR